MKHRIYCVGKDIRVVSYDTWYEAAFFAAVATPTAKKDIDNKTILNSFLKYPGDKYLQGIQYFYNKKDAKDYINNRIDLSLHPYSQTMIDTPALFEIEVSLVPNSRRFRVETLINASIKGYPLKSLNYSIKPKSVFNCLSSRTKNFYCHEHNFNGDFNQLMKSETKVTLAWMHARGIGLFANDKDQPSLPEDILKEIAAKL